MLLQLTQTTAERALELRTIFLAEHRRLYKVAYQLTASRHEAEDVVQEVFLRLHARLEQFSGGAKLSTWLYRMTVNASLDALRRFKRRRNREASLALPEIESEAANNGASVHMHNELEEKIQLALARLRKPYRAAIVLRDFEGLAYDEIAEVLQIDKGTVASRLHRGYAKLQKELAALGVDRSYLKEA